MINNFFSPQIIEALGWALLHSLWQGTLLAVVLGILMLLMRKYSSDTRYIIIAVFMALFTAVIPVNFIHFYKPTLRFTGSNANKNGYSTEIFYSPSGSSEVIVSNNATDEISSRFVTYFEQHLPLIVTLWLLGMLILLLRYLGQLAYVERLKHHKVQPFPPAWHTTIAGLQTRLKVSQSVRYLESRLIPSPLTIGWLKPVILFPVGLIAKLTPQEVEVILLHELAHIKRHDYLFKVLQSLATVLLFYHPASWWMSRLLDEERENCCDDLVVRLSGEPNQYAHTLIHLQEQKLKTMKTSLSITGGTTSSFGVRILRLINHSIPATSRFREGFVTALILVAGLSFLAATGIKDAPKAESNAPIVTETASNDNKVDLLINAIDEEDEQLFNYLLEQKIDINAEGSNGWTPLGFAASEGRLHFAKLLLDKGAKVNHPANSRRTPLLAAALEGHLELVKLFIERGASTTAQAEGQNVISLAASEGHMETVNFLTGKNLQLSEVDKVNLLIVAIDDQKEELFNYLIKQGVNINGVSSHDWTPLGFAAGEGREKFVRLLLDKGAKVNYPPDDDNTPYIAAAREGHLEVVKMLLERGIPVDASFDRGTTALATAAREGHMQVVEFLLAKGAKVNKTNEEGRNALHFASSEGHTHIMERLIAAGANIEQPITATHIDMERNETRKIMMFNWTPLLVAIEEEKAEAVALLLDAGAKVNIGVGKTVYAIEGSYREAKAMNGKLLYEATGWTPLMEAVEKQNVSLVKLLIAKGADVNAQTKEGMSVKSIAREKGNAEIIQLVK